MTGMILQQLYSSQVGLITQPGGRKDVPSMSFFRQDEREFQDLD